MLSSALFLIVGILIMVEEFWHRKIGIAVTCSCWILLVFFTVQFFHGSWDIYNTYAKCMARDRLAKEQIAAGEKNLTLADVKVNRYNNSEIFTGRSDQYTGWNRNNVWII